MRSLILGCLATLGLAAVAVGQAGDAGTPQATSESRLAQVTAITEECDKARQAFYQKLSAAKTDDERAAVMKTGEPSPSQFVARLWPLIEADAKDEAALQALSWIATTGGDQVRALPLLMEHHVLAESIGAVCLTLERSVKAEAHAFLRRVMEENPNAEAQGKACYALANSLLAIADAATRGPGRSVTNVVGESGQTLDASLVRAQAEELFQRCVEEYSDVPLYGDAYSVGDAAKGVLFEAKNLQIGMAAPDISGTDAEGVAFKLSDYRGKVVVVDFWGYW